MKSRLSPFTRLRKNFFRYIR